ncbi:MAG: hypothetical protein KKB51_09015 [Candidatus Riflebacteria bacterium]|nr:hypothetical protein [Candidatus Riflebacteria bacterium]
MKKNSVVLITALILCSVFLTGWRPPWGNRLEKECRGAMAGLEEALAKLGTGSVNIKGSGESIEDYPFSENNILNLIPVCPVEKYREPKATPYFVEKDADGNLTVRCGIHGTRINPVIDPWNSLDPSQQQLLEKAIGATKWQEQTIFIFFAMLIGFGPALIFLLVQTFVGKAFIAKKVVLFQTIFLLFYGLILYNWILFFLSAPPPMDNFLRLSAVTSLISFFYIRSSFKKIIKEKT